MKFFFDNNLAPNLAKALHALTSPYGNEVIHLREFFAPSTPDIDWIKELAKDGAWTIVSGDLRITRLAHEREAWRQSKLTGFFLASGWTHIPLWDQAWQLVKRWPDIEEQAKLVAPGAGFEVPIKGRLKQLAPR